MPHHQFTTRIADQFDYLTWRYGGESWLAISDFGALGVEVEIRDSSSHWGPLSSLVANLSLSPLPPQQQQQTSSSRQSHGQLYYESSSAGFTAPGELQSSHIVTIHLHVLI